MKANVRKDDDGLDNIDDFWQDEEAFDDNDRGDYDQEDDQGHSRESGTLIQQPRHYVEQELPEELLSTPTSRRARTVPMSRGSGSSSTGSARGISDIVVLMSYRVLSFISIFRISFSTFDITGLSIPGNSAYDNMGDDYQSPSFHAVKKRLVFTRDSSDVEPDQDYSDDRIQHTPRQRQMQQHKGISGSPALDRLLSATNEKRAMASATSQVVSSLKARSTAAATSQAPGSSLARTNPSAAKMRATNQAPVGVANSRRPLGIQKAFDFGDDFGLADNTGMNRRGVFEHDDENDDQYEALSRSTKTAARTTARTAADFKRVSKVAPSSLPQVERDDEYEYDDHVYHEPEPQDDNDDRLRFSDEDENERYVQKENDEDREEEELIPHRQRKEPVQQKRSASTKAPTARKDKTAASSSTASTDIPRKQHVSKKKVEKEVYPRKKVVVTAEQTDDDENEREVPSSQTSSKERTKSALAKKGISKTAEFRRHHETPQELVLQEVPIVPDVIAEETGVRRSQRTKIAPLEFWKNERVVLGRNEDVPVSVPVIKGVLRAAPQEAQHPPNRKRRRAGSSAQSMSRSTIKSRSRRRVQEPKDEESSEFDEELEKDRAALGRKGFKEEFASLTAETLIFGTDKIVPRVIAESRYSVQFKEVEGGQYQFHRGLEDADSVVSGTMKIKPGGQKPSNNGNGCSMVFYIIQGLVRVTVHESEFVLSTGGRFLVPRSNQYSIKNLSRKESLLFFVQSKTQDTSSGKSASTRRSATSSKATTHAVPEEGDTSASSSDGAPSSGSVSKPDKGPERGGRRSLTKGNTLSSSAPSEAGPSGEGRVVGKQRGIMASFFH
ncbi:hypothetical protein BGX28_004732 [Mortierella sp. GBA30]|nr:hypothetical protein BGX28_004732 [Mortierella sp. GBA30]